MSSSDSVAGGEAAATLAAAADAVFEAAERALADETTGSVADETIQKLMTAASRLYARKLDTEDRIFLPVVSRQAITATEAVITACEVMRAADLNPFDLAMWYNRPRPEGAP
jgi:hypothetical protein